MKREGCCGVRMHKKGPKKKQHQLPYLFRSPALSWACRVRKMDGSSFFLFLFFFGMWGARSWSGVCMQGCLRRRVTQIRMGNQLAQIDTTATTSSSRNNNHACGGGGGGGGGNDKLQDVLNMQQFRSELDNGNKWARKHYSIIWGTFRKRVSHFGNSSHERIVVCIKKNGPYVVPFFFVELILRFCALKMRIAMVRTEQTQHFFLGTVGENGTILSVGRKRTSEDERGARFISLFLWPLLEKKEKQTRSKKVSKGVQVYNVRIV